MDLVQAMRRIADEQLRPAQRQAATLSGSRGAAATKSTGTRFLMRIGSAGEIYLRGLYGRGRYGVHRYLNG